MKSIANMTVGELAAYVSSHLRERGIDVVLSGGSCVAIYSDGKYVSKDLDFIETRFARRPEIREAMAELGFIPENRFFTHLDCDYLIEFPTGPLAVGKEPVAHINEIRAKQETLTI